MPITALYAALLVPLLLFLTARVIGWRQGQKVEIGDGGDKELLRRMRVHANFIEYVPMALILLGLAESLHTQSLLLHACGIALIAGRHAHAYALSQTPHILPVRVAGMVMTLGVIGLLAVACLINALRSLAMF